VAELLFAGSDPTDPGDRPNVSLSVDNAVDGDYLQITWLQLEGGTWNGTSYQLGDVTYSPEGSIDLQGWAAAIDNAAVPAGMPPAPAGYKWACTRLALPVGLGSSGFLRVGTSNVP
jgi:hypothetical protein